MRGDNCESNRPPQGAYIKENRMAKEERGLVVYESRGQTVELTAQIVRDFLVTGKKELVSNQEIAYFLGICKARQLNPFVKDCYLIKYGSEPAAIVTAIDFYRSRARAASDCTGWEKGVICLNKETGELRYSKGLVLPTEELVGGWFKARPTGWTVDLELEVNLEGYIKHTSTGEITKFWRKENQPSQIMKVAESQGLRTVWPDLFQGTITADERNFDLDQIDAGMPPPPGSPGDITPKPEPEPEKLDTSKFDKAVKKLKWDKETMTRLEKWLADTAVGASNKSGKSITPDMIKVSCVQVKDGVSRFDDFLAKFKEWQDVNYPAAPQAPPVTPPNQQPVDPAGQPEQDPGTPERSLTDRKDDAWRLVCQLGIPLKALAAVNVSTMADINEDNIGELEELIATYPKKGK